MRCQVRGSGKPEISASACERQKTHVFNRDASRQESDHVGGINSVITENSAQLGCRCQEQQWPRIRTREGQGTGGTNETNESTDVLHDNRDNGQMERTVKGVIGPAPHRRNSCTAANGNKEREQQLARNGPIRYENSRITRETPAGTPFCFQEERALRLFAGHSEGHWSEFAV